eukprot:CAMPEP_0170164322 /NCGR_PEP_ID=MMETSP0033_2-20121228/78047_1 /TAXON_ID=195969 /ORGANISM="Dolichomastix tenuilepis, Strain CCMP3274" /LENGTH=291 /DNA_ID=CAMNT_0010401965 /DNA_START=1 /DNA_END=877 /DNA_ORIENTATION=+
MAKVDEESPLLEGSEPKAARSFWARGSTKLALGAVAFVAAVAVVAVVATPSAHASSDAQAMDAQADLGFKFFPFPHPVFGGGPSPSPSPSPAPMPAPVHHSPPPPSPPPPSPPPPSLASTQVKIDITASLAPAAVAAPAVATAAVARLDPGEDRHHAIKGQTSMMQLAEWEFHDLQDVRLDMTCNSPGSSSPSNEGVNHVSDHSTAKFLDFNFQQNGGTTIICTFGYPHTLQNYKLQVANDEKARDPYGWTVSVMLNGSWKVVSTVDAPGEGDEGVPNGRDTWTRAFQVNY